MLTVRPLHEGLTQARLQSPTIWGPFWGPWILETPMLDMAHYGYRSGVLMLGSRVGSGNVLAFWLRPYAMD